MTRNEFVIAAALLALNAGQNVILVTPSKPITTAEDYVKLREEAEAFRHEPGIVQQIYARLTAENTKVYATFGDAYDPLDIVGIPYVDGNEIKRTQPRLKRDFEADQVLIIDDAQGAATTVRDYILKNKDRGRLVLIFRDTYGLDAFNEFPGLRLTLNPEYTAQ